MERERSRIRREEVAASYPRYRVRKLLGAVAQMTKCNVLAVYVSLGLELYIALGSCQVSISRLRLQSLDLACNSSARLKVRYVMYDLCTW